MFTRECDVFHGMLISRRKMCDAIQISQDVLFVQLYSIHCDMKLGYLDLIKTMLSEYNHSSRAIAYLPYHQPPWAAGT